MSVSLTRSSASHGAAPQWLGVEVDNDGHARSWQNVGNTVGRFARDLLDKERAALRDALAIATDAPAVAVERDDVTWRPEGTTEHLQGEGLPLLELDPRAEPPAGFENLLAVLRGLMGSLVDSPVAAITLDVDDASASGQLRHVGSEPLHVRLGSLPVEVQLFGAGDAIVDSASRSVDAPADAVDVGPGWSFDLGELGVDAPTKGQFLVVNVEFDVDADGDGVLRRARLSRMLE